MDGPVNENATPQRAPATQPRDHTDSNPDEANAESRRRWVDANRDRVREMNRRWRAEHLDRARQLNRDSMRRAAARKRREAELRARGRERAKRWRDANPDRVREYQQQWVKQNREKVREYYNNYYAKHRDEVNVRAAARRDADPDRTKQARKRWADRNKERIAELQRNRRSNPETYESELAANAAARQLKRRLSGAGLPPKRLHAATAAERRNNERKADAFFSDPALPEHLRQSTVFAESLAEQVGKNGARMREFAEAYAAARARMGLPPVPTEDIVYSRAVELVTERLRRVDLLTSRDAAAAVRGAKAVVRQHERKQQFEQLVKALVAHSYRNLARLTEEAAIESRARVQHGKPRVSTESLILQLATQEVVQFVVTSRLTIADVRSAARFAKVRVVMPLGSHVDNCHQQARRDPIS